MSNTVHTKSQAEKSVTTRFKAHLTHIRNGRTDSTSVIYHVLENSYSAHINYLSLVRHVNKFRELDSIYKNIHNLNPAKCPILNVHCIIGYNK